MAKGGKKKVQNKSKPVPKKPKTKNPKTKKEKEVQEEEPEFSSENEYMYYVGSKDDMKNKIEENFDEPYAYLMGNSDNIVTKSTYTKIEYENGKPINEEVYQSESVNHKDKKGHNIAEKKEKYKNEKAGIEKISHQKLMDGKGTKVIKQINLKSGNKEEHNIYKGIKEKNVSEFNKKYNSLKQKVKLDEMFEKAKLLGQNKNSEKGKVLLLGDGNENKQKEDKKENKNKKEKKPEKRKVVKTKKNVPKTKGKNKNKKNKK
jgi:hypothetical protein